MRVNARAIALISTLAACGPAGGQPDAAARPPDAAPRPDADVPPRPPDAPKLAPVAGASALAGKELFARACTGCHGPDGKGGGPFADSQSIPPTDLTGVGYVCRTTVGKPVGVPADADVEGALDRGSHRGNAALSALKPRERRSLTMYVKSLARDFGAQPQPVSHIPEEPPDDAASRARGRTVYLAIGCWQCHGIDGRGGDPEAVRLMRWNGRPVKPLRALGDEKAYRCGSAPADVYRRIQLGIVSRDSILMPPYEEFAERLGRPDKAQSPEEWTRSLEGKVSPDEIAAVRAFYQDMPTKAHVRERMSPAARRARGARFLWDLVHYVLALE